MTRRGLNRDIRKTLRRSEITILLEYVAYHASVRGGRSARVFLNVGGDRVITCRATLPLLEFGAIEAPTASNLPSWDFSSLKQVVEIALG